MRFKLKKKKRKLGRWVFERLGNRKWKWRITGERLEEKLHCYSSLFLFHTVLQVQVKPFGYGIVKFLAGFFGVKRTVLIYVDIWAGLLRLDFLFLFLIYKIGRAPV